MTIRKRGRNYHYDFTLPGYPRMRGVIPEARTKWEAEQAEIKLKREVFENRYDLRQTGKDKLSDFIDKVFLSWSKLNKRSWREDIYISNTLKEYFRGKTFREISPMLIEKFKGDRLKGITKKGTQRCPATVNREFDVLSKIFSLAIDCKKADTNPCTKVKKLRVNNQRYRYLLPEEEPRLMAALDGPRAHLKPAVIVALGTGMRLGEQLRLKRRQVDFLRSLVTPTETKNGKDRDIPMNVEVRAAFVELCKNKSADDYVFASPKTDGRLKEVKKGFKTALRIAGIEGLRWHDLRATFGTRLGEAGYDGFTIAQLMGHSDIRMTARYVRGTERNKRAAVEAVRLDFQVARHNGVTRQEQPPTAVAVSA
jgi:integrase